MIMPLFFAVSLSAAHGETRVYDNLTEEQKQKLASMQKDIMEKKKQLINKYVEYGIIDQERGKKSNPISKGAMKTIKRTGSCRNGIIIKKSFININNGSIICGSRKFLVTNV
ncbi:DUF2680 domain-containing protein [Bacillus sonorensis]|nr:DUF2680 domain-containing protein [Bacillus sonorensis]